MIYDSEADENKFISKTLFLAFSISLFYLPIPLYRAVIDGELFRLWFLTFSVLYFVSYKFSLFDKTRLYGIVIFALAVFLHFFIGYVSNGLLNSVLSIWGLVFSLMVYIVNKPCGVIVFLAVMITYIIGLSGFDHTQLPFYQAKTISPNLEIVHLIFMAIFILYAMRRLTLLAAIPVKIMFRSLQREQELSRAKDLFLSNMSHELRTPLNGIYGALQLVEGSDETEKAVMRAAKKSAESLNRIVSDILDIQKLSSGKLEIAPQWNETAAIFEQAQNLFMPLADINHVTLNLTIDTSLPNELYCDELRLGQILNNLVGNAIKFTEQGSVSIATRYEEGSLIVSISDTGIGMDDISLNHLFDRFTQADSSLRKKYAGTGLGMAITKELIELMAGSIDVASQLGQGTTFTVKLPLQGRN